MGDHETASIARVDGRARLLEEMTTEEVRAVLAVSDVAILTPSAIEQHGGHLPLGTDWYIGIETTRRAVEHLASRGHVALGYAFPLGISQKFLGFAGSLTLSHTTFIVVVKEIAQCLYGQGFRRFVLLSGNGGNAPCMRMAARQMYDDMGVEVLFVDPLVYQGTYRDSVLKEPTLEHHGAEGETSKILAIHPEFVHMDKAVRRELPGNEGGRPRHGPGVERAHERWEESAPHGYVGAPDLASAGTGDTLLDRNSQWVAEVIAAEYFASGGAA